MCSNNLYRHATDKRENHRSRTALLSWPTQCSYERLLTTTSLRKSPGNVLEDFKDVMPALSNWFHIIDRLCVKVCPSVSLEKSRGVNPPPPPHL